MSKASNTAWLEEMLAEAKELSTSYLSLRLQYLHMFLRTAFHFSHAYV
jgi:hypothetical protein